MTVTRQRPTPTEIAAMVELGVTRGLSLIDSFQVATGNRSLTKVHKRETREYRRIQRAYAVRRDSIRSGAVGGAGVAVLTGAVGALTLTPGWWVLTGIGAVTSLISFRKWNSLGPAPRESAPVMPAKALPRGAIGKEDVTRYLNTRTQVLQMQSGIRVIHPDAAIEMRAADSAAAPALNTLVERLAVLHDLRVQLPHTSAAHSAEAAALVISANLRAGCDGYDTLLAAAAKLMAAPGLDMNSHLQSAADALIAYSFGLERAADL